jgi:hypothetical protein
MKAGRVHAVIAAALENPQLLTLWQREPNLLTDCGVDPDQCDLNAIWKFAGLTAKVRHNGLRADLPLTFRLLNVAGLEIEVFASYASFRTSVGGRYGDTSESRTQDLLTFLEQWLDFGRLEHALLWDMIRHEVALARLSRLATPVPESASSESASSESPGPRIPVAASSPRICGDIILYEMRSDPRSVGEALQEKSPRLGEARLGTFLFCYWRKSAATEINILQLDQLGFYLLSIADGTRTLADLSALIGGSRRPAKGMLNAVNELAAVGILRFDPSKEVS